MWSSKAICTSSVEVHYLVPVPEDFNLVEIANVFDVVYGVGYSPNVSSTSFEIYVIDYYEDMSKIGN